MESLLLKSISGIAHGFGTSDDPIPSVIQENLRRAGPQWKQVHGVGVGHVERSGAHCGEVDALYTGLQGVPVAVVTADCVPILMCHVSGKKIAAVHAGWRGTYAQILRVLWERLRTEGEDPGQWVAAVGPAIGPCCYEVSAELVQSFQKKWNTLDREAIQPTFRHLDLPSINAAELKAIGIKEVDVMRFCTRCFTTPQFYSYRRATEEKRDSTKRQYSGLMIRA